MCLLHVSIHDPLRIVSLLFIHLKSTMREILSTYLNLNERIPQGLRDNLSSNVVKTITLS